MNRPDLSSSVEPDEDDPRELIEAWQEGIERRLEEGLESIRLAASSLMHEIASEVWRAAGGDKDQVRSQILLELSRDQAIRSLIAHSDERFQALAVRTARLEDTLNLLADSVSQAREQLADSIAAGERASVAGDAGAFRSQLADVTRQVATALETLAERDQAIVDAVRTRIKEHGELIMQETAQISRAMESYVQHGVEAIGHLAGSMEAQIQASGLRDRELAQEIGTAVQDQTRLLGEQLQLMYERMALETSSVNDSVTHLAARNEERARGVGEYLDLLSDRVGVSARDSVAEIRRVFEGRVLGLAQLVRSDSEVLRNAIVRTADGHDDSVARAVDERLASLARLIRSDNETIAQQIVADQESSKQALRAMKELQASLPGEVIEMVEQRFASLAESIERSNEMLAKRIDRMAQTIGDRHDTDIQVVIDRMGDAMHALASLGRGPVARTPEPRIELE